MNVSTKFSVADFKNGLVQVRFQRQNDSLLDLTFLMGSTFGFDNLIGLKGGFYETFYKAKSVVMIREGKYLPSILNGDWRASYEPFHSVPVQDLKDFDLNCI